MDKLAPYEQELAKRGTPFIGEAAIRAWAGMLDYMMGPFVERFPVLRYLHGDMAPEFDFEFWGKCPKLAARLVQKFEFGTPATPEGVGVNAALGWSTGYLTNTSRVSIFRFCPTLSTQAAFLAHHATVNANVLPKIRLNALRINPF